MIPNVLIVPGYHGSGNDHWQTWLESQIPSAKRVSGIDWERPILHNWAEAIIHELEGSVSQTVIIAHSFGCLATAMAIANRPDKVAGVILVAPADPERFTLLGARKGHLEAFPSIAEHLPDHSLNTLGLVIGSQNDPWMKLGHAYAWSKRWKLAFHNAGKVGHINVDSGFGPWPLIQFLTESLCNLLSSEPREWARTATVHELNRFLPLPALTFNQQHLLYA